MRRLEGGLGPVEGVAGGGNDNDLARGATRSHDWGGRVGESLKKNKKGKRKTPLKRP